MPEACRKRLRTADRVCLPLARISRAVVSLPLVNSIIDGLVRFAIYASHGDMSLEQTLSFSIEFFLLDTRSIIAMPSTKNPTLQQNPPANRLPCPPSTKSFQLPPKCATCNHTQSRYLNSFLLSPLVTVQPKPPRSGFHPSSLALFIFAVKMPSYAGILHGRRLACLSTGSVMDIELKSSA